MSPSIQTVGDYCPLPPPVKETSDLQTFIIHTLVQVVVLDGILYGCFIPFLGVFLGRSIANWLDLALKWEVCIVVIATSLIIFGAFVVIAQSLFWKPVVLGDIYYTTLLKVRDGLNTVVCMIWIVLLGDTVQDMMSVEKSEWTYVGFVMDEIANWFSIGTLSNLDNDKEQMFQLQCAFLTYWSMITVCITKFIYFNTLFTYLRCMETFTSMNPTFEGINSAPELGSVS